MQTMPENVEPPISIASVVLSNPNDEQLDDDIDGYKQSELQLSDNGITYKLCSSKSTPSPPTIVVALFKILEQRVPPLINMHCTIPPEKIALLEERVKTLQTSVEKYQFTDLDSFETIHIIKALKSYTTGELTTMLQIYLLQLDRPLFVPSQKLCQHIALTDTLPTWSVHQTSNPLRHEIYRCCKTMDPHHLYLLSYILQKFQLILRRHVISRLKENINKSTDEAMLEGSNFLAQIFTTSVVSLPIEVNAAMIYRNEADVNVWVWSLLNKQEMEIMREASIATFKLPSMYATTEPTNDYEYLHKTTLGHNPSNLESTHTRNSIKIIDTNQNFPSTEDNTKHKKKHEGTKEHPQLSWLPDVYSSDSNSEMIQRQSKHCSTTIEHVPQPTYREFCNLRGIDVRRNVFNLLISLLDFNIWHKLTIKAILGEIPITEDNIKNSTEEATVNPFNKTTNIQFPFALSRSRSH